MTKAELIRKIAKRSGVPDSETKFFFELFLQRASAALKKGEALKLKGVGFFQLRKGVIKESANKPSEINSRMKGKSAYYDLIAFFPLEDQASNKNENLIFNIPAAQEEDEFSEIDSHFSISIGKPVIPLEGIKDTDFFIPQYGNEMRKMIETKVDRLLKESEKISNYSNGNDFLIINPGTSVFDQNEIKLDKIDKHTLKQKFENSDYDIEASFVKSEFGHVAWDFGEDLSKQIEEESILDEANDVREDLWESLAKNTQDISAEKKEPLDWEFTAPEVEVNKKEDEKFSSEEINKRDQESKNILSEFDEAGPELGKFEQVKSFTSEFTDDKFVKPSENGKEIPWSFGGKEIRHEGIHDQPIEKNNLENVVDKSLSGEELNKETVEVQKEIPGGSIEEKLIEPDENKIPDKISAEVNRITSVKEREYSFSKDKSPLPFVIALVTIIAVGAALFFYVKRGSLNLPFVKGSSKIQNIVKASSPVIIERNFDIPVTYPYSKSAASDSSKSIVNKKVNKQELKNDLSKSNKIIPPKINPEKKSISKIATAPVPDKPVQSPVKNVADNSKGSYSKKMKDNVFKSGENFIVQISSWQSAIIANKEAERFKKRGFISFVEKAEIPGKGIWYRVKVGNFKSLSDVQNFLKNNQ